MSISTAPKPAFEMKIVPLDKINSPDFQRGIFDKHPIRIQGYVEAREGSITLAEYKEKLWVLDGQQRTESKRAAIVSGQRPDLTPKIAATILYGLTWEQMAQEFVRLNADRKGITAYDSYRAGIAAKLPDYLALKAAVESVGLQVGKSVSEETYAAISPALRAIQEDGDAERVRLTLRIFVRAFPGQRTNARLIEGLLHYLTEDRAKTIDEEYMARRLQTKYGTTQATYNAMISWAEGRAERHVGRHFFANIFGLSRKKPIRERITFE